MLGLRYKFVNSVAEKSPGSPIYGEDDLALEFFSKSGSQFLVQMLTLMILQYHEIDLSIGVVKELT